MGLNESDIKDTDTKSTMSAYLLMKGIYISTLRINNRVFRNYIPDKKLLIVPLTLSTEQWLKGEGITIIDPNKFSPREIYSRIMNHGHQDINYHFLFRRLLIRGGIPFRYHRRFKRLGLSVDFYFKEKNLALDFCLLGDTIRSELIRNAGKEYRVYRTFEYKEAYKELTR